MRRVLSVLLLLAFAQATRATTVHYARATITFQWTAQGLQARTQAAAALWHFEPVSRSFSSNGAHFAPAQQRCTAQGIAGGGPPAALLLDRNSDDHIDRAQGDSARLVFGAMLDGRTSAWFALDVSDPFSPSLRWVRTQDELPGLGEALNAPAFARLRIGAANSDPEHFAVLFGAGKNPASGPGLRLLALDASNGALLWSAGTADGASLRTATLRNAIGGAVAPVDLDGDGFADRLYVGDEGGAVWRFDLRNGAGATDFASATVIAQLDGALRGTPDVAFMPTPGGAYLNIALASGVPDDSTSRGWLYSLRDRLSAPALPAIHSADLPLAADPVASDSRGWRLPLAPGEWLSGTPVTIDGRLLFTTFRRSEVAASDCQPLGGNRVHALSVVDASAVLDLDADGRIDARDRSRALTQRELVHGVQIRLPRAPATGEPPAPAPHCTAGTDLLPGCVPGRLARRTFWYRMDAD
ncbi:MAG: hypothetical protein ABIT36_10275 [Steroidobacteraceae bacterium]